MKNNENENISRKRGKLKEKKWKENNVKNIFNQAGENSNERKWK
jgi:hypothetical protein